MENNLKIILEEFEKLKGQHIIVDLFNISRLIAIGDDGEDWYYVTFDGRNIHWSSCVGRIIPLKGYLRNKDYDFLIRIAKLNHIDQLYINDNQEKTFLDEVDKEIAGYSENHKFITELCWDLN